MKRSKILGLSLSILLVVGLLLTAACSSSSTPAPAPAPAAPATSATPAAPAPATSTAATAPGKTYKFTFALFQPAASAMSQMNTAYAQEIQKRTNGQVTITVMQAGSLLAAPAMYEGIKNGVADMGNCPTSYNPGNFPFSSIAELPSAAQSGWVVAHAMVDFFNQNQPKEWNEVRLLTTTSTAADLLCVASAKSSIVKVEDWKGKTVRCNHADLVTAMGGTVKDVAMADMYDALSKGVIDAVVGSAEPLKSWKLADVGKNITIVIAPVQPSILWYNAMNKNAWSSLTPDLQKIFTDVSTEYSAKLGLCWDDQSVAGLEYAKSVNARITFVSPDEANKYATTLAPAVDARIKNIVSKGFAQADVQKAWDSFKSRVDYWNGQQAANNIKSLADRLSAFTK
jgi:TRAP-type transport system periplasmic protein